MISPLYFNVPDSLLWVLLVQLLWVSHVRMRDVNALLRVLGDEKGRHSNLWAKLLYMPRTIRMWMEYLLLGLHDVYSWVAEELVELQKAVL